MKKKKSEKKQLQHNIDRTYEENQNTVLVKMWPKIKTKIKTQLFDGIICLKPKKTYDISYVLRTVKLVILLA